eukprot:1143105-Pelagomonas_calceolata.AAC.2
MPGAWPWRAGKGESLGIRGAWTTPLQTPIRSVSGHPLGWPYLVQLRIQIVYPSQKRDLGAASLRLPSFFFEQPSPQLFEWILFLGSGRSFSMKL